MSSTTIIVRAIDELQMKTRSFVNLVFGVLIIEDVLAILLMVLLTTVSVTKTLSGAELVKSTAKLSFFMILWFLLGIYLVPQLLQRVRKLLTPETTLIVSIGLCLMMVLLATSAGFSPALGAFVMGSILAETREGKTIEHLIVPVKDLFAAVFFVSVGMLIDPKVIVDHFGIILVITFATVLGKLASCSIGALIAGQSLRQSVQAGLSLAQIGEFSFIIATLGKTLGVTSGFLYPITVAVSAITTFTTPYQIKYAENIFGWIESKLPSPTLKIIEAYQRAISARQNANLLGLLWDVYGVKIVLNSVLVVAITLAAKNFALPMVLSFVGENGWVHFAACIVTLLFCAPFFFPIVFGRSNEEKLSGQDQARLKAIQLAVVGTRFIVCVLLVTFIVGQFISLMAASGLVLFVFSAAAVYLARHMETFYRFFEAKFLSNLQEKDVHEKQQKPANTVPTLAPWEANLTKFVLSANSNLVTKSLKDSKLKEDYGVTVALIERGNKRILTPGPDELLLPYDKVYVIGEEKQLEKAQKVIEVPSDAFTEIQSDTFGLEKLVIGSESPLKGKKISESGVRERINGLIVGIERDGQRYLSPNSSMELSENDIVWLVGDKRMIKALKHVST